MRLNEDKNRSCNGRSFPGIGEIIGGSQREESLDVLKQKMTEMHVDEHELWWYLILENWFCSARWFWSWFRKINSFRNRND
jgi:aspartyl/asparaginyl-tRNA synthetase